MQSIRSPWLLLIAGLLFPVLLAAQERGTFTDPRDNREYTWSKVGNQVWLNVNLRYAAPEGSWVYNDEDEDTTRESSYGRLYSWKAAQSACPKGWHLPSDKEWKVLVTAMGGEDLAGARIQDEVSLGIRSFTDVHGISQITNQLLAGIRHPDGTCLGISRWGGCWTSGKANDSTGNNILFVKGSKGLGFSTNDMRSGMTVRCIRNK